MNITHIKVDYPTELVTIVPKKPEQVARERLMNRNADVKDHYRIVTKLNQPQKIYVNQVRNLIEDEFKSNDDRSVEQTGLTASAYQSKFGRAFNE